MLALYFYRVLWVVLSPLVDLMFIIRLIKGKEDKKRIPERLGFSKIPRPQGKLLWLHAASVGESLSILPLIRTLQERQPSLHIFGHHRYCHLRRADGQALAAKCRPSICAVGLLLER